MNFFSPIESEGCLINIPNDKGTPERNLLVAVLERALLDYVGNDTKEREAAISWLFAPLPTTGEIYEEFSLGWICQQLDLDLADILEKIKSMPRRGNSRIAPWYLTKRPKLKLCLPALNRTDRCSTDLQRGNPRHQTKLISRTSP